MNLKKAIIIYQYKNTDAHIILKNELGKNKIKYKSINRSRLSFFKVKNYDIIFTIGGDGTFLRTSHFVKDQTPILCINSDPLKKVGFFARANQKDIRYKIQMIIKNKFKVLKLSRVKCIKNGKPLPFLALNEFFFSHSIPYKMSRYWLNGEYQRSSGVLISTASGSYAWIKSAGGKEMPLESKDIQYQVRELYKGVDQSNKKTQEIISSGKRIRIESEMKNGIIVVDCLSEPYKMKKGDEAIFCNANNSINLIVF